MEADLCAVCPAIPIEGRSPVTPLRRRLSIWIGAVLQNENWVKSDEWELRECGSVVRPENGDKTQNVAEDAVPPASAMESGRS